MARIRVVPARGTAGTKAALAVTGETQQSSEIMTSRREMTATNQHEAVQHMPSPTQRMSREEINLLPIGRWEGKTHVIRTTAEAEEAAASCARSQILGFDTETRPSFRKGQTFPPSLLQLATDREVFIFQLQQTGLSDPLLAILDNASLLKTGVGLKDDLRSLQALAVFEPRGFIDLAALARQRGLTHHGLRGLAAAVCGIRISKSARTSNWAQPNLTPQQIQYAATDAWIGREIYLQLEALPLQSPHRKGRHSRD